jgi:FkbM family methyltransferase
MGEFKYKGPMRFEIDLYPNFITQRTKIQPKNVFEIGANNGNDAEYLRECFDIDPANVFCFEPNPYIFPILEKNHSGFNNFNIAISDKTGKQTFNCSRTEPGSSSFKKKVNLSPTDFIEVEADTMRMDSFINHYQIESIDLCKIDVEGFTLEVLKGFGNKISIIKSVQVENERGLSFEGQKDVFQDTCIFLSQNGFTLLNFVDWGWQCDSLWIRNDMISYQTPNYGCDLVPIKSNI